MAFQHYVSITGSKQGQFKGGSTKGASKSKWGPVLSFAYGVESPRDASTGQSIGKRNHGPLVITKETNSSSPQYVLAHLTNEYLVEVTVETRHPGTEAVTERITLTNAVISKVHEAHAIPHGLEQLPKYGLETVTFDSKEVRFENFRG
jgi:type VI secretion system Hcp family effector